MPKQRANIAAPARPRSAAASSNVTGQPVLLVDSQAIPAAACKPAVSDTTCLHAARLPLRLLGPHQVAPACKKGKTVGDSVFLPMAICRSSLPALRPSHE